MMMSKEGMNPEVIKTDRPDQVKIKIVCKSKETTKSKAK